MAERGRTQAGGGRRRGGFSLDVVLLAPIGEELSVLLHRELDRGRERWTVPYEAPLPGEALLEGAQRIARAALGAEPAWLEQVGAFADGRRHPAGTELSVGFVGVVPQDLALAVGDDLGWVAASALPAIPARQREIVRQGLDVVRVRLDHAPIAFSLLPPTFSLSDLQQMYELLLGRRLHKASFRRSLQAAELVEPIDEWRSEGRGRPAQLFRYAPSRKRKDRRAVRFDLLGG